jgi:DNA-binding response OmpR family regulator
MGTPQRTQDEPATRHVRFKEILIVEDDETWALGLRDALAKGGYRVSLALALYEAVRRMREKVPDLFVVSALLGEQAAETLLRELEGLRVPPPILLVGPRPGEIRWEAWRSLPSLSVVGQPFELADVLEGARGE